MASSPSPLSPVPGQQSAEAHASASAGIPQTLWSLRVPLYITRKTAPSTPFVTSVPRFSYLAQLLPRLSAFFGTPCSSFHHEEVQMRNLTVGLLVDLYQPQLPWKLQVGDGDEWDIGDTFLNGVKEVSAIVAAARPPRMAMGHGSWPDQAVPGQAQVPPRGVYRLGRPRLTMRLGCFPK